MEYVTGRDTAARSKTQIKKDDPEKTYGIIKDQWKAEVGSRGKGWGGQ